MLSYTVLQTISKTKHYQGQSNKFIVLAKKAKTQNMRERARIELFKSMSYVIVNNIENFFSICEKNYGDILHERDEMVSEAFLIMETCLSGFDLTLNKKFYWYYNKSLTRAFQRMIDRTYYKHRSVNRVNPEYESFVFSSTETNIGYDLNTFYMEKHNLNGFEKNIVKSLMDGASMKDFCEEKSKNYQKMYQKSLTNIREKFEPSRL